MGYKMERAMKWWFLPLMAIALSILLDTAQGQESGVEVTTMHGTTTVTLSLLRTQTITIQTASASAALDGMMAGGEEYLLHGCYGLDGPGDIGTILGANYTTRTATTGAADMSLSTCLEFCGSPGFPNQQPYTYVGVSDGQSCYCGTSLNSTARQGHPEDCSVPCQGNTSVACGGRSFMLIYKLSAANNTLQELTGSNGTKTSSGIGDANSGPKSNPGITAAVAMGSICGFGILLSVLILGTRRWKRRKQRGSHQREPGVANDAGGETKEGPETGTHPPHGKASVRDATRVELRTLDGIVMDGQLSPINGPNLNRLDDGPGRRPPYAGRAGEIIAATTGAEWRTGGSPVTPRGGGCGGIRMETPKPARSTLPEDGTWDEIPHTPSILVQHPDSVAQNHGLGERAWHRRRFSTPFPPSRYDDKTGPSAEVEGERRASSSQASGDSAGLTDLKGMESFIPAPLNLPRFGRDVEGVSVALSDDDGGSLSPRWSKWTKWTLPSSSPVTGSPLMRNVNTSAKAGKAE
ncbi:Xylosyltransferase oxt [Cytospora mali]|uniref:Xylosyltransferase oxt n=1 Tax=Cytospora mali TaxID=578113 RepID=A0A194V159_CYTMA|nr:Xylosyltransferase oxt [Valsa mali var. pyri (nom. inval.)]